MVQYPLQFHLFASTASTLIVFLILAMNRKSLIDLFLGLFLIPSLERVLWFFPMRDEDIYVLKCTSSLLSFTNQLLKYVWLYSHRYSSYYLPSGFDLSQSPMQVHGFPAHHQLQLPHSWGLCCFFLLHLFADCFLYHMIFADLLMSSAITGTCSLVSNTVFFFFYGYKWHGDRKFRFCTIFFKTKCPWRAVDSVTLSFGIEHCR